MGGNASDSYSRSASASGSYSRSTQDIDLPWPKFLWCASHICCSYHDDLN